MGKKRAKKSKGQGGNHGRGKGTKDRTSARETPPVEDSTDQDNAAAAAEEHVGLSSKRVAEDVLNDPNNPFKPDPSSAAVDHAASTLARSKRESNIQKQLTTWQDRMVRANEDRTITVQLVSDYARFLQTIRDKLEQKMFDIDKRGKVLSGLVRSAGGPRRGEYEAQYFHNREIGTGVFKDIEVLNLHISAWKSSNAFRQLMTLGEERCIRVGGSDEKSAQYIEKPELPEMSFEELLAHEKEAQIAGNFNLDVSASGSTKGPI